MEIEQAISVVAEQKNKIIAALDQNEWYNFFPQVTYGKRVCLISCVCPIKIAALKCTSSENFDCSVLFRVHRLKRKKIKILVYLPSISIKYCNFFSFFRCRCVICACFLECTRKVVCINAEDRTHRTNFDLCVGAAVSLCAVFFNILFLTQPHLIVVPLRSK
jgi:hypothetical protein